MMSTPVCVVNALRSPGARIAGLVLFACLSIHSATFAAAAGRPIVADGTVKTADGDLLRGCHAHIGSSMSTEVREFFTHLDNVIRLRDEAHLNCIRVCVMAPAWGGYNDPNQALPYVDAIVDNCETAGVYAIINYHGHLNGGLDELKNVWQVLAPRYPDKTFVMYNLINELMQCDAEGLGSWYPNDINEVPPGWSFSVAQGKEVYDIVRTAAPNTMIYGVIEPVNIQCDWGGWLLNTFGPWMGIDWAEGKDAFSFHTYVASNSQSILATKSHGVPILCSEYSFREEGWPMGDLDGVQVHAEWLENNGVSHIVWQEWQSRNAAQLQPIMDYLVADAQSKGYVWWSDDTTPPTMAPTGLTASPLSDTEIRLTWDALPAQAELESDIRKYAVYQDGVKMLESATTSADLSGLAEATEYEFAVAGVNLANLEGPRATVRGSTLPDTRPPEVAFAYAVDQNTLAVYFTEPVDRTSAQSPAGYTLSNGVTVSSATLDAGGTNVELQVTALPDGTEITVAAGGVQDLAQTPNSCTGTASVRYPTSTGIAFKTYEIDYACELPAPADLLALSPAKEGIQTGFFIGASSVTRTDDFAMLLTSHLLVTEPGTYMFYLAADEGAAMYLNGEMLIDNGGCHTREERAAGTTLDLGVYPISVVFAEDAGTQTLALQHTGPGGGAKQPIPQSQLLLLDAPQGAAVVGAYQANAHGRPVVKPLSPRSRVLNLSVPQYAGRSMRVHAAVFDPQGSKVGTLFDGSMAPGPHRLEVPQELGTGGYVCRISIGGAVTVVPIVVVR